MRGWRRWEGLPCRLGLAAATGHVATKGLPRQPRPAAPRAGVLLRGRLTGGCAAVRGHIFCERGFLSRFWVGRNDLDGQGFMTLYLTRNGQREPPRHFRKFRCHGMQDIPHVRFIFISKRAMTSFSVQRRLTTVRKTNLDYECPKRK
jgi:hypothetical protein